jgi:hypothetical protein
LRALQDGGRAGAHSCSHHHHTASLILSRAMHSFASASCHSPPSPPTLGVHSTNNNGSWVTPPSPSPTSPRHTPCVAHTHKHTHVRALPPPPHRSTTSLPIPCVATSLCIHPGTIGGWASSDACDVCQTVVPCQCNDDECVLCISTLVVGVKASEVPLRYVPHIAGPPPPIHPHPNPQATGTR